MIPEYMRIYFQGEKAICFYAVPIGLFLIGCFFFIWKYQWTNDLAKSFAVTILVTGCISLLAGGGMLVRSNYDINRLTTSFSENPQSTIQAEITRMERVNRNWLWLKLFWASICVGSVATLLYARQQNITGIALGMLLVGTLGFAADIFAERRAEIYTRELASFVVPD